MARYPSDESRFARWLRPLNVLDDADNKLSPVKINCWAANCAGAFTAMAGIFGWITGHVAMLNGALQIGSLVGPYWGGSHVAHHYDKKLMKGV